MRKPTKLEITRIHLVYYVNGGWQTEWFVTLKEAQNEVKRLKQIPKYRITIFRYMKIIGYE